MFGANNTIKSINVAKLVLQETGTYNPMYFRPYETHVDGYTMDAVNTRLERSPANLADPNIFSGLASNIISPSATVGPQISIPYGWTERRMRFILEVSVKATLGTEMVYYFQGYTTHLGISQSNYIDPNMEFIINSFIRVSRLQRYGANGIEYVDKIVESAQVVNGQIMTQYIGEQIPGMETGVYGIRPQDVFTGIASNHLKNSYEYMGNAGRGNVFLETRLRKDEALCSSRANGLPSSYISNLVNSYQISTKNQEFGQGIENVYDTAIRGSLAYDPFLKENYFLRALANIRGIGTPDKMRPVFTLNELSAIDPNVQNVTNVFSLGHTARAGLMQAGQHAYWNGADRESVVATILSNAVPAIMMDLMITKIHFRSTNHDISGRTNTAIIDGKSVTNADLSQNFAMFLHRLEKEVLFDITFGNQELYMLEMSVDIFGDSMISIGLGNNPMTSFGTPSFCDSLSTPVATVNKTGFDAICHDFETMFSNIQESSPTSIVLNQSI